MITGKRIVCVFILCSAGLLYCVEATRTTTFPELLTTLWTSPPDSMPSTTRSARLQTMDSELTVKPGENVTLQCRDVEETGIELLWYKASGKGVLRSEAVQEQGLLLIPNITCEDEGVYICYPGVRLSHDFEYPKTKVTVLCDDEDKETTTVGMPRETETRTESSLQMCSNSTSNGTCCHVVCKECGRTEGVHDTTPIPSPESIQASDFFRCSDGYIIPKRFACNMVNDCSDGSDEFHCWSKVCGYNEFKCRNGHCISNSLYCDGEIDCLDGSDEFDCPETWLPKIITLPSTNVDLFCVNPFSAAVAPKMLELECEFIGNPVPTVKWKKYEGHVARKCIQFTSRGRGLLRCPDFEQSDQGAYSCVAENSAGSSESQPKTIVKCLNEIECRDGFKVVDHLNIETCLNCFCSGKASACAVVKSEPVRYSLTFEVNSVVPVLVSNHKVVIIDGEETRRFHVNSGYHEIAYRAINLDAVQVQAFLKAYGRNMNVPRYTGHSNYVPHAPDVIIRGNGLLLKYTFNRIGYNSSRADVRFWPGHWHHNHDKKASRSDIMRVLSNVDLMLFRCEYEEEEYLPASGEIVLESSRITEASESVSYLEKCTCPEGYEGLSCEACAAGYVRKQLENDFVCDRLPPRPCPEGMSGDNCDVCDDTLGYYLNSRSDCVRSFCNMNGSLGLFPDSDDNCICKEYVVGKSCSECRPGSFYLDKANPEGCKRCWCNEVSTQCTSSNWYRTVLSSSSFGGYNSSNGRNFWLLSDLKGNLLTSYGGYMRYSMKHRPQAHGTGAAESKSLVVEILSGKNVLLKAKTELPADKGEKMHVVQMEEPFWRFKNDVIATRQELLTVLSDVTAIYIESPYSLTSDEVSIGVVQLDVAEEMSNSVFTFEEEERVEKVEKCECPLGYSGLSCETCSPGYYKKPLEPKGFICVECDCPYCDVELGCMQCKQGEYRDNPITESPPFCIECPCNGNELLCYKDSYDQVTCKCKPSYHGIYCEHAVVVDMSHLKLAMSPMRVKNNKAGTVTTFNCSYESTEELQIVFQKIVSDLTDESNGGSSVRVVGQTVKHASGAYSTADVTVDLDVEHVECLVYDYKNVQVGRVVASVEGTVVDYLVPSIQNCFNEPKYVSENEDFDLICEASGMPHPDIRWYTREGKSVKEMDTANGVHTILSPGMDLNGTVYTCIATNILGDDKCSYPIFVRKKCDNVYAYPEAPVVEEGDSIEIHCSTTSGAGVSWSRAETPWYPISSNGTLAIKEALPSDGGLYVCARKEGKGNKTIELVVNRRKVKPSVRIVEEDTTLSEGNRFVIHCEVVGVENPRVTWRKDSGDLPFEAHVKNGGMDLEIYPVTQDCAGLYDCSLDNGSASSSILIRVLAQPKVSIQASETRVLEGTEVVLMCSTTNPRPETRFTWWKINSGIFNEPTFLRDDQELRLNVRKSDAGRYMCRAENEGGVGEMEEEITVVTLPSVTIQPRGVVSHFVDEKLNVTCTAEGTPEPTIQWLRRRLVGDLWGLSPAIYTEEPINDNSSTIRVQIMDDLQGIICLAENEVGSSSDTLILEKRIRSRISPGESQQLELGSSTKLVFTGITGNIKCRRKDRSLLGDECYLQNGLEISSVQVQHRGVYVCYSEDSPLEEKSFAIVVKGFVPRFHQNESSYLVLPLKVKSKSHKVVEVTFKAEKERGLILLGKMHHEFLLFLDDGRLKARILHNYWSPESEHVVLNTETPIELHVWYTAIINLEYCELSLYDEIGAKIETVSSEAMKGMRWKFMSRGKIYVGGTSSREKILMSRASRLAVPSFEGCVSRVIMSGHEYKMSEEGEYSKDVSLCKVCSSINPCGGERVCHDAPTRYGFVCVCDKDDISCPRACRGEGCDSDHDLCDLLKPCGGPENQCYMSGNGLRCECSDDHSGLTCGVRHGFCSTGDGFVRLPSSYLRRPSLSEPEVISMTFTTESSNGLLLRQGDHKNYLLIALKDNILEYNYVNQGYELKVWSPLSTETNTHRFVVTRMNNTVTLDLDGVLQNSSTTFTTNRVWGYIYIGGDPNGQQNLLDSHLGFHGCIKRITFGVATTPVNILDRGIFRQNVSL